MMRLFNIFLVCIIALSFTGNNFCALAQGQDVTGTASNVAVTPAAGVDNSGTQQLAQSLGQNSVPLIPGGFEEGTISLDLRNIDVADALKFLALRTGMNIISTKNVQVPEFD